VFSWLAFDSYEASKIELARFTAKMRTYVAVTNEPVDLSDLVTALADTNNKNVAVLQESIRRSARLSFWLNTWSCFMAVVGFAAQLRVYRYERRQQHHERGHNHPG